METQFAVDLTSLEDADARDAYRVLRQSESFESVIPHYERDGNIPARFGASDNFLILKQIFVVVEPELRRAADIALGAVLLALKQWWQRRYKKELKDEECTIIYKPDGNVAVKVPKPPR
jgi:hypothetical protein